MVNASSLPCFGDSVHSAEKSRATQSSVEKMPSVERHAEKAYSSERASWFQQIRELSRRDSFDWLRDAAPPAAREDRDLILAAVDACGAGAMHLAARDLRQDRDFVLAAVGLNGFALGAAAPALLADREFILEAVARDGDALDEATPELRADHSVVLAAVSQKGTSLRFAAVTVQTDREILLVAAVQDPQVLADPRIAGSTWISNRGFVMAVVRRNGMALKHLPPQFQAERDVVLAAVAQSGTALSFAAPWLQADPELILMAKGMRVQEINDLDAQVRADQDVRGEN